MLAYNLSSSAAVIQTRALAAVVRLASPAGSLLAPSLMSEMATGGIVARAPPGRVGTLAGVEVGVGNDHFVLPVVEVWMCQYV